MNIGVTGTAVIDTIDTADGIRTSDMGGIYYAVHTLSALLPSDARLHPVIVVGADAIETLRRDWSALPGVELDGVKRVAAPNNRVHIGYHADGGRDETQAGGLPSLGPEDLAPWPARLDAWLWNLVSGTEVERSTFDALKRAFEGPLYLDLHSLCLEPASDRARRPRRPLDWEDWVTGITWLQLNATEAALLWTGEPDPLDRECVAELAAHIHGLGVRGVLVTYGADGAAWYGTEGDVFERPGRSVAAVDPTGCGDVFGAAWLALHCGRGQSPEQALEGALVAATTAATIRGTSQLHSMLKEAVHVR
jgi:sugar/nucleoside kinase (ribokinase family)